MTLVPPGNVFSDHTIEAAQKLGIKIINCQTKDFVQDGVNIVSNENVLPFHDKEIVENDGSWLEQTISRQGSAEFVFVRDLPRAL